MKKSISICVIAVGVVISATILTKSSVAGQVDSIVRLQPASPGIQQVGNANLSGTARVGSLKTNAFQLGTSAVSGRVLTTDASGNGTWQNASGFTLPFSGSTSNSGGPAFSVTNVTGDGISGISNASGFNVGVYGQSDSTVGKAVYGVATANSGGNRGGQFESYGTAGAGVFGYARSAGGTTYGGEFLCDSVSGYGVYGITNAATGTTYGAYGQSNSTSGTGVFGLANATSGQVYGVYGQSNSTTGVGLYGLANTTTGNNRGIIGHSNSTSGIGILGECSGTQGVAIEGNESATSGSVYGVEGNSNSPAGAGVFGVGGAGTGVAYGVFGYSASTIGRGVYGLDTSSNTMCYGVVGESISPIGYGLFSNGNIGGTGTKAFVIDDPLDPEDKFLKHYCAEGPEPRNVYQGSITTGHDGYAWVQLPAYYEEINRDPLYQLTVVDSSEDFVMAKVTKRIDGNRFQIRTSKPNVEVCWRVDAIRNDRWVRKNGAPVELEKDDEMKGKYLQPELYGKPAEMGIGYQPRPVLRNKSRHP